MPGAAKKKTTLFDQLLLLREAHKEKKKHIYVENSFYCLPKDSAVRKFLIALVDSRFFTALMLTVTLLNAWFISLEGEFTEEHAKQANYTFTAFYTGEMILKMLAYGLYDAPDAYVRDRWNIVDFIVVVFGWISAAPSLYSVSLIRLVRLLRLLWVLRVSAGVRVMVDSVLAAVPALVNVMLIYILTLFFFGLIGLFLFEGRYRQQCFGDQYVEDGAIQAATNMTLTEQYLAACPDSFTCVALDPHPDDNRTRIQLDGTPCSVTSFYGFQCPSDYQCLPLAENPNSGVTSFDNIGIAFVTIVQQMSLEGWTDNMFTMEKAMSRWADLYFVALTFIGAMFVVNLVVAVLFIRFQQAKEANEEKAKARKKQDEEDAKQREIEATADRRQRRATLGTRSGDGNDAKADGAGGDVKGVDVKEAKDKDGKTSDPARKGSVYVVDDDQDLTEEEKLEAKAKAEAEAEALAELEREEKVAGIRVRDVEPDDPVLCVLHGEVRVRGDLNPLEAYLLLPLAEFQQGVVFNTYVIFMILLNCAIQCLWHYRMSSTLYDFLDGANIFFTIVMGAEIVIRILGSGFKYWVRDPLNLLDFGVILFCIIQFGYTGHNDLGAIRAFRLLRMFRVLRKFPALRKLMVVLSETLRDLMYFGVILFLFVFMFTCVGIQLFRGKMNNIPEADPVTGGPGLSRENYETFWWSVVSVFQAMTTENWNSVLYDCTAAIGWGGAVYAILIFVLGAKITLGLFLAMLLGNFADDAEEVFERLEEQEAEINGKARDFTPFQALRAFVFCIPRSWWMCCECGRLRVEEEELGEREAREHARAKAEEFANQKETDGSDKEDGSGSDDEDGDKSDKKKKKDKDDDDDSDKKKGGKGKDAKDAKDKKATVVVDGVVAAKVDDKALRLNTDDEKAMNEVLADADAQHPKKGFRRVFYSNGDMYSGFFKYGERNGNGEFVWAQDGKRYTGQWKAGYQSGMGTMTWTSGHIYQGQWERGMMNGAGMLTYPDGSKYVGTFKDGWRNGVGVWTDAPAPSAAAAAAAPADGAAAAAPADGAAAAAASPAVHVAGPSAAAEAAAVTPTAQPWTYDGDWLDDQKHGKGQVTSNGEIYDVTYAKDQQKTITKATAETIAAHLLRTQEAMEKADDAAKAAAQGSGSDKKDDDDKDEKEKEKDGKEAKDGKDAKDAGASPAGSTPAAGHVSINMIALKDAKDGKDKGESSSSSSSSASSASSAAAAAGSKQPRDQAIELQEMDSKKATRVAFAADDKDKDEKAAADPKSPLYLSDSDKASTPGSKRRPPLVSSKTAAALARSNKPITFGPPTSSGELLKGFAVPPAEQYTATGSSFFVLSETNPLRKLLVDIVNSRWFDYYSITVTVLTCIMLALDSPVDRDPDSSTSKGIEGLNWLCTFTFSLELIVRITAQGLVFGENTYLRDAWNFVDFCVCIAMIATLAGAGSKWFFLRAIRAARALRPLRLVMRYPTMRAVLMALWQGFPGIVNVMCVVLVFYFMFGLLAVQLMEGRLWHCETADGTILYDAAWDETACKAAEAESFSYGMGNVTYAWRPFSFGHFDHIGASILTLFGVSTVEGWPNTMYASIDGVGNGAAPVRDYNMYLAIFYVSYMCVVAFLGVGLFSGVVGDEYDDAYDALTGADKISDQQKEWLDTRKMIAGIRLEQYVKPLLGVCCNSSRPALDANAPADKLLPGGAAPSSPQSPVSPPAASGASERKNSMVTKDGVREVEIQGIIYTPNRYELAFRHWVFNIITSEWTDAILALLICANVIFLSMYYFDASKEYTRALDGLTGLFVWFFMIEMLVKIYALGWTQYTEVSGWNRYDFAVSLLSWAVWWLSINDSTDFRFLRITKILRIFSLIPKTKRIHKFVSTLVFSLPGAWNVFIVLFLVFFLYAIMGMALWGRVKFGQFINEDSNFTSFYMAMMMLLRCGTGESWEGVMYDASIEEPYCDETVANDCGDDGTAIIYFTSFVVLAAFIVLNLFVGVVLKAFQDEVENEKDDEGKKELVSEESATAFFDVWRQMNSYGRAKKASDWIACEKLPKFINALPEPLGCKEHPKDPIDMLWFIHSLQLAEDKGKVHYLELLSALAFHVYHREHPEEDLLAIPSDNEKLKLIHFQLARDYPHLNVEMRKPKYTISQAFAAIKLQVAWRNYRARKKRKAQGKKPLTLYQLTPRGQKEAVDAAAVAAASGSQAAAVLAPPPSVTLDSPASPISPIPSAPPADPAAAAGAPAS